MYSFASQFSRDLIDKYLSLQWCKDNLIIPITSESNSNNDIFRIAIPNYSYLGTIAEPIKYLIKQESPNIEISYIEKIPEEIEEMLDKVSVLNK